MVRTILHVADTKFCFLSGKQSTTLPISGQPNVTKFAKRGSVRRWILVEIFWKFAFKGSFFQKTLIVVNNFRLQAAISQKWLQILENDDRLLRLWNVGFPSVLLEPTQSHSPGHQTPYNKGLSWTLAALPSSAADVMSQSNSHGGASNLTLTLHYC